MNGAAVRAYSLAVMAERGFDVNSQEVDAAIEAAVLKLHQALEVPK